MGKQSKKQSLKQVVHEIGDTFFYNLGTELGQFGVCLLFGLLVLTPLFPKLYHGFALMLPAGFVGGHGYATAIGKTLQNYGWEEALTVGYTSATVGLLAGVFGGMLLINIATRRGWTRLVKSVNELPESMLTGFVPEGERNSMGQETVNPIALDPFTWHFALVMAAFAIGYFVYNMTKTYLPGKYEIPMMCLSMLAGVAIQKVLDAVKLGQYVDRHVMNRIGSWVTDYLVAFGVASIKISVVVKYAAPMTLLYIFGVAWCMFLVIFVGRKVFHNFWFERSIFVYGWNTGVVAMGVTLLRVVDPNFKTRALEDYGMAYVFISFIEIAVVTIVPGLVANGIIWPPAIVLFGTFVVCMIMSRLMVGWFNTPANKLREGEAEIIAEFQAEEGMKAAVAAK